jgi:hypothetical protein
METDEENVNGSSPEGGNGDASKNAGKGNDANPDKSKNGGNDDKGTEGNGKGVKTYTQEQLDDIVEKRLARERKKAEDDAKLSETDRLKKELAEKDQAIRMRDARDSFCNKLGISGEKGNRIFKAMSDEIEIDDKTGKITNLDAVAKLAKEEFPELFGTEKPAGSGDGGKGKGSGGAGGGDMNSLIRRGAGR